MNKKLELRRVRDFGEIINDTFVFMKENFLPLLKAYAILCGFFVLASLAVSILNQLKIVSYVNTGIDNMPFRARSPFGMFGIEYILAIVFGILSYTSISITTFSFVALYREKENTAPSVEEVWSYFKFYFFSVLGSSILLYLGLGIAFIFCLVPGFWIWPAFSLVIPVLMVENTSLGYAFNRGFQLVKGNYWMVLGVLVITVIIVYVAMMVFVFPISIITTGTMVVTGHKLNSTYVILTSVITHICQFFLVLPSIAIGITYFSLTEQKDGTGLMDRINNLGNTDAGLDPLPSEEY